MPAKCRLSTLIPQPLLARSFRSDCPRKTIDNLGRGHPTPQGRCPCHVPHTHAAMCEKSLSAGLRSRRRSSPPAIGCFRLGAVPPVRHLHFPEFSTARRMNILPMFLNVFIPWAAPELRLEADRSYHFRFGREATSPHSVALSARCFQFFKWKKYGSIC